MHTCFMDGLSDPCCIVVQLLIRLLRVWKRGLLCRLRSCRMLCLLWLRHKVLPSAESHQFLGQRRQNSSALHQKEEGSQAKPIDFTAGKF